MVSSRLLVLGATVLWSTAGAVIKLSTLSAWQVASGRSLVAAFALLLFLPPARRWPSGRVLKVGFAYATAVVLFVLATKFTTAANAIFLQGTAPLYVLLLSPWLLREQPSRGELTAVPVFLLGLALFFLDQLSPGQLTGNLLAIVCGLAFALCIMGLRAANAESTSVLVWGNIMAGMGTLAPALGGAAPSGLDVGLVVYLGVFQLAIAYTLFNQGLRNLPAVEASLLALMEPVLNPVWTFFLAGERPGQWALLGGGVILCATVWRTVKGGREARQRTRSAS